jgi:L-ascorbate metabolism protein UlaG (beta-lactamase superfamily)
MPEKNEVTIKWLGHSCFLISLNGAMKIVTDPFDPPLGYPMPDVTADICLISHDHHDHNFVSAVKGKPQIIKGLGKKEMNHLVFKGIASFHDEEQGSRRGDNTIFVWELGGIKFAHLGDLGTELSPLQIKEIGPVDILFIPTGGVYTIDAAAATKVISSIEPRVAIPMHYQLPSFAKSLRIAPVEEFLKGKDNVVKTGTSSISFSKESLPMKTTIYVLEFGK